MRVSLENSGLLPGYIYVYSVLLLNCYLRLDLVTLPYSHSYFIIPSASHAKTIDTLSVVISHAKIFRRGVFGLYESSRFYVFTSRLSLFSQYGVFSRV